MQNKSVWILFVWFIWIVCVCAVRSWPRGNSCLQLICSFHFSSTDFTGHCRRTNRLCVSGARVCARRYVKVIPLCSQKIEWNDFIYVLRIYFLCVNTIRYLILWLSGSMSHDLRDDFNLFLLLSWWWWRKKEEEITADVCVTYKVPK